MVSYKSGKQLLYQFSLIINGICKTTQKVGFRKIDLVQVNDKYGKSFYFKINNIPIQIWGQIGYQLIPSNLN